MYMPNRPKPLQPRADDGANHKECKMTERLRNNPKTAVYLFDDDEPEQPGTLQEKISMAFLRCLNAITRAFVRAESRNA